LDQIYSILRVRADRQGQGMSASRKHIANLMRYRIRKASAGSERYLVTIRRD
jgi:hypothetical protein